jgi:parvulin-like peptidyl-prolyl isomerase
MNPVLQLGDIGRQAAERLYKLDSTEILPLLAEYQLLPALAREMIVDTVVSSIECTPQEEESALEQIAQQYKEAQEQGGDAPRLKSIAIRRLKLEKFKNANWAGDIDSYFFQRKSQLDRVVYSLISHSDLGVSQEIYFRIQEGEQSLARLAREYAHGPEAETDGLIGPVELQSLHPVLARILSLSQPNQLLPPTQIGNWFVIVRLEKLIPAQLDRVMRQRLLDERFNQWLQSQIAEQNWQVQPAQILGITGKNS